MKELIDAVYTNLQNLQLQPTEHNVMLLADSLMKLKEVYAGLPEENPEEPDEEEGDG